MIEEHTIKMPDLLSLLNREENKHNYKSCISQIEDTTEDKIDFAVVYTQKEQIRYCDEVIDAITVSEFQI